MDADIHAICSYIDQYLNQKLKLELCLLVYNSVKENLISVLSSVSGIYVTVCFSFTAWRSRINVEDSFLATVEE